MTAGDEKVSSIRVRSIASSFTNGATLNHRSDESAPTALHSGETDERNAVHVFDLLGAPQPWIERIDNKRDSNGQSEDKEHQHDPQTSRPQADERRVRPDRTVHDDH